MKKEFIQQLHQDFETVAQNVERLQAREKLTQSEKLLSGVLFQRGVDSQGFARVRSKGDEALFGGHNTQKMKEKLGVPENRPLADFLPTLTIKAKDFANEITTFNTTRDNLHGENMPVFSPNSISHRSPGIDKQGLVSKPLRFS